MKIAVLSTDVGLFCLLCIYLIHSGTTVAAEKCAPENCQSSADKCAAISEGVCENPGDACCSVVKSEFATLCKQFGGICRSDFCGQKLRRRVTDCPKNQVCCVLV